MTRVISLVIVLIIILYGCKDNMFNGKVFAYKNLIQWRANAIAVENPMFNNTFDLVIEKYENGFHRESLNFVNIPNRPGRYFLETITYPLVETVTYIFYTTLLDDGHVLGDKYILMTGDTIQDYIEVELYENDIVKGSFQISLKKDTIYLPNDPNSPELVTYTNGIFFAWID